MPLWPAPMTTPSYSRIFAMPVDLHGLNVLNNAWFKTFQSFNRCAQFKPSPSSSPATRGRMRWGLERFERLERLEPPPEILRILLQVQVFLHNPPTVVSRPGDHRIRGMHGNPDLVQVFDRRPVVGDLFDRPSRTVLARDLACDPNRTAAHIWTAA